MVSMARLSSLGGSVASVRSSASSGIRSASRNTSHSLSGGNYVPSRSFGTNPRRSYQGLRFEVNGGRASRFDINAGNVGNYVSVNKATTTTATTATTATAQPTKMQQATEVITAATGLTKTIFEGISMLKDLKSQSATAPKDGSAVDTNSLSDASNKYNAGDAGSSKDKTVSTSSVNQSIADLDHAYDVPSAEKAVKSADEKIMKLESYIDGASDNDLENECNNLDSLKQRIEDGEIESGKLLRSELSGYPDLEELFDIIQADSDRKEAIGERKDEIKSGADETVQNKKGAKKELRQENRINKKDLKATKEKLLDSIESKMDAINDKRDAIVNLDRLNKAKESAQERLKKYEAEATDRNIKRAVENMNDVNDASLDMNGMNA